MRKIVLIIFLWFACLPALAQEKATYLYVTGTRVFIVQIYGNSQFLWAETDCAGRRKYQGIIQKNTKEKSLLKIHFGREKLKEATIKRMSKRKLVLKMEEVKCTFVRIDVEKYATLKDWLEK